MIFLKCFCNFVVHFAKLRAVAFIKNKHHLLLINRQRFIAPHQVIEFLNGGDNDFVVVLLKVVFLIRRAV